MAQIIQWQSRLFITALAITALVLAACGGRSDEPAQAAAPTSRIASAPQQPPAQQPPTPAPASCIKSADAAASAGKRDTVCGEVSGASYQPRSKGQPTFINFDRPFPNHTFVAVIWTEDRAKFNPAPELQFGTGKNVCVTGAIEMYQGKPQIVVRNADQIRTC